MNYKKIVASCMAAVMLSTGFHTVMIAEAVDYDLEAEHIEESIEALTEEADAYVSWEPSDEEEPALLDEEIIEDALEEPAILLEDFDEEPDADEDSFAVKFAKAPALKVGVDALVSYDGTEASGALLFTPEKDGLYTFSSRDHAADDDTDTYAELYTMEGAYIKSDNNSGYSQHFSIFAQLVKGQTVVLLTSENWEESATYYVTVSIAESLTTGKAETLTYQGQGCNQSFWYIPETTGMYLFSVKPSKNANAKLYLYNEEDDRLAGMSAIAGTIKKRGVMLKAGEMYLLETSSEVGYSWLPGASFTVLVERGKDIKSIALSVRDGKAGLIEGNEIDGEWDWDYDENGQRIDWFDYRFGVEEILLITFTYTDGSSESFSYEDCPYKISLDCDMTKWKVGGTQNTVQVTAMDAFFARINMPIVGSLNEVMKGNWKELKRNGTVQVAYDGTFESGLVQFTPDEDGVYWFYSLNGSALDAFLYEVPADLKEHWDFWSMTEKQNTVLDFQAVLKAHTKYILRTQSHSGTPAAYDLSVYKLSGFGGTIQTPGEGTAVHTHSYGPWKQTKAPTALERGEETRKCACGDTQTRAIPKLPASLTLNVSGSVPLQTKQTSSVVKASGLANGDYVKSASSSKTNIVKASVSGNTIKLTGQKKTGSAKITVLLASGKTGTFTVKVQKAAVKTKKVEVAKKKLSLSKGKKFDLEAAVTPITSKEKLTFETSDKKIASVSSKGVVTAGKKKGTATITVTSGSKSVKVKVTVE